MKFLTVLIIIFAYRNWIGGNPIRQVVPFESYAHWFRQQVSATNLRYLICVGVPVVLAFLLAAEIQHWLFGLIWLAFSVLVLVYSIEINDVDMLFDDQNQWLRGLGEGDSLSDARQRQADFRLLTIYEVFQSLYPSLFWFLLLGPAGALLYILSRLYLDDLQDDDPEVSFVDKIVFWMEWPAARLTGLVFALLGNFGKSFETWLDSLQDLHEASGSVLLRIAGAAVDAGEPTGDASIEAFSRRDESTNEELRVLLDRTLFGWLGLAAIVAILGF